MLRYNTANFCRNTLANLGAEGSHKTNGQGS